MGSAILLGRVHRADDPMGLVAWGIHWPICLGEQFTSVLRFMIIEQLKVFFLVPMGWHLSGPVCDPSVRLGRMGRLTKMVVLCVKGMVQSKVHGWHKIFEERLPTRDDLEGRVMSPPSPWRA